MVRAAGFEPAAPQSQAIENQDKFAPSLGRYAQISAQISDEGCPDLAQVVESWERLSVPLKQAVLAIVAAAEGERGLL